MFDKFLHTLYYLTVIWKQRLLYRTKGGDFITLLNSAENVLNILFVWTTQKRSELGLTEISRFTGINKTTVYKILLSLKERGMVSINPESKKYKLDVGILELSNHLLKNLDLYPIAHPLISDLAARTQTTVTLAICKENYLVFIDRVDGSENARFYCDIGKTVYYNTGAAAKAAFAFLTPERQRQIMSCVPAYQFTQISKSWDQLQNEVSSIRKQGYAVSDEEVDLGVYAIGAPIFDHQGKVIAGMAMATLKFVMTPEREQSMVSYLLEFSRLISQKLGCPQTQNFAQLQE